MPDTPIPQNVGPYQIIAPLGQGGMGQVYRARDSRLNRDVALKLLPPEYSSDPVRKQRFEQEARAVAALNHPGILSIYDVGEGWMVTELVDGETLRGAELAISQIIDIGAQIAEALAAAHETGITHRDLKPDNILLTADGRTKILDFGLAQVADSPEAAASLKPEDKKTITTPGIPLGTPGYMSPEQVRGQTVDQRSDIFSLGVVLYELLSGKPAFEKPSALEVMHAILTEDPDELPASVPDGLRRIIRRCLEKKPGQRFQSARDLAFALRSFGALMASASSLPRVAEPTKQRPVWFWALVAIVSTAALLALFFLKPQEQHSVADIANYKFQPFAFSQGEEFSGVWSPDGQSIAFLQQTPQGTHLLAQSLDAPGPTQLANQAAQPAWSSDGSRIYYLDRNEVQAVSRAGGQPQVILARQAEKGLVSAFHISPDGNSLAIWQVVTRRDDGVRGSVWISSPPGAAPVEYTPKPFEVRGPYTPVYLNYSPDGKLLYLSMTSGGGAETWILPVTKEGGAPKRIFADTPWNRPVAGAWMPDSQRLVLAGNPAPATGEQLFLADIRANSLTRLLAWPEGGQTDPSVSPDGKHLLFAHVERDRDIVQLPLDGSEPKTLLATSLSEFSPAWSPVNEEFAYVTRRNGTDELWVRSAEANWDRPVVTAKEFKTLEVLLSPKFSPDGSRIAYTALLAGSGLRRRSLAISPAAGGAPTVVADGYGPTWAPDGSAIAFLWAKPDGTIPVAKLRLGSDQPPQELIPGSGAGVPEWSPSGEWIASSTPGGVALVSPDGKKPLLLPSLGNPAVLAWSKDSKTIYALAYNAEPPVLQAMDVHTQSIRKIAEYPNLTFTPLLENLYTGTVRLSLAPDGKSVAVSTASSKSDLWILDGFAK